MEPLPFENDGSIQVVSAMDVLDEGGDVHGDNILVMGGGLVGCEAAVYLAHQGKQVTLTTRRSLEKLAENIVDKSNRAMLEELVQAAGIDVLADAVPVKLENGEVVIRPMMYLALTYDHRIIDGKEAVQFLVSIKEQIEDPSRLLLQI